MKPSLNSFWSFQLLGWLVFFVVQSIAKGIEDPLTIKDVVLSFAFACTGLLITTLMRQAYLSKLFLHLNAIILFFCCFAVCLVAATGMNVFIALFIKTYALAIDNTPIAMSVCFLFSAECLVA